MSNKVFNSANVNILTSNNAGVDCDGKILQNIVIGGDNDAVPKSYIDAQSGFKIKEEVIVVTNLELAATYDNGTAGVGATLTADALEELVIDGVTVDTIGQRVLVKDQTTGATEFENGIYELTTPGVAATTAWVLTRTTDADTASELDNALVADANNGGQLWFQTTSDPTVGTDPVVWTIFSSDPVTAGDGLLKNMNELSVDEAFNFEWTGDQTVGGSTTYLAGSSIAGTTDDRQLTVDNGALAATNATTISSTLGMADVVTFDGDTAAVYQSFDYYFGTSLPAGIYTGPTTYRGAGNSRLTDGADYEATVGDIILVDNGGASATNGVFEVADAGSAGNPFILELLNPGADTNAYTGRFGDTYVATGTFGDGGNGSWTSAPTEKVVYTRTVAATGTNPAVYSWGPTTGPQNTNTLFQLGGDRMIQQLSSKILFSQPDGNSGYNVAVADIMQGSTSGTTDATFDIFWFSWADMNMPTMDWQNYDGTVRIQATAILQSAEQGSIRVVATYAWSASSQTFSAIATPSYEYDFVNFDSLALIPTNGSIRGALTRVGAANVGYGTHLNVTASFAYVSS